MSCEKIRVIDLNDLRIGVEYNFLFFYITFLKYVEMTHIKTLLEEKWGTFL